MDNNSDDKMLGMSPADFQKMLDSNFEFKRRFTEAVLDDKAFEDLFETDEYKNFCQQYEIQEVDLESISSGMPD